MVFNIMTSWLCNKSRAAPAYVTSLTDDWTSLHNTRAKYSLRWGWKSDMYCPGKCFSTHCFTAEPHILVSLLQTQAWFPDYMSGCFTLLVISWQYPYTSVGGLGFYLPDLVANAQCDGLGKIMAIRTELPKWNPTLDDWENVPTPPVKKSVCSLISSTALSFFPL